MLNKFFKFLRGYVIINVYGKNAPRFLSICLRRGFRIYGARLSDKGILVEMDARDFTRVRDAAKKCRVRVRIKEKHTVRRAAYARRYRIPLLIAVSICVVIAAQCAGRIWLIEIDGADDKYIDSITATLDEIGVKRGTLKKSLPDGMTMKKKLLEGTDGLAWAWVYIDGVKARVQVYEKIIPPSVVDKSEPCDIVASCDGVVRGMTVKAGEERVREGDAVNTGDILVAGTVSAYREGDAEKYILIHSIAEVRAYTTHTASGEYKLTREVRTPTGRRKRWRVLELFGKALSLPHGNATYENYDRTENRFELNIPFFGYSGVALNTVGFDEVNVTTEQIPLETVLENAKNELEEKIAKELTPGAQLDDKSIEYEQTDNETIKVTVRMNFTENIAASVPIGAAEDKGEKNIDDETDRSVAGD